MGHAHLRPEALLTRCKMLSMQFTCQCNSILDATTARLGFSLGFAHNVFSGKQNFTQRLKLRLKLRM